MTITLKPELEELIKQDIQRGPYQTVEEFVEHAVSMLHEHELFLAENSAAIAAKIEEGYAAAQRGELIGGDQVRANMDEKKRVWLAEQRRA